MPARDATMKELVHFAKLPKLQHLLLNLDLTPVYREDTPTPAVGLALHTLETKGHFSPTGDLAALAKALLLLWPNLQYVTCRRNKDITLGVRFHETIVQSLNSFLSMTREAIRLKDGIAKKYESVELAPSDFLSATHHPTTSSKE
ncbi:hypothetical protein RSOLAG1IB_06688 [Rhizoctonia solani AG-1 IB]|uniref:Uncharacterized protein n=1 Tax=Thanatephorus cucumeris (strain AG1-IB / isolate 7/3/14) TaxID=1108050 RepID=A0A0B7F766_THACB|nr:hypothetical protein RSOLAG1IB_06688 [Rhizoctonia solani AG-1 IB]